MNGITSFWGHSVRLRQNYSLLSFGNSFEQSLFIIRLERIQIQAVRQQPVQWDIANSGDTKKIRPETLPIIEDHRSLEPQLQDGLKPDH